MNCPDSEMEEMGVSGKLEKEHIPETLASWQVDTHTTEKGVGDPILK